MRINFCTIGCTTDLTAYGNGDGVIDPGDYGVWKQNFGATLGKPHRGYV